MAAQPQPRITPEQYLELERAAEFRHEYYNGRIYAMSGGTYPQARITANLSGQIYNGLRKKPCGVLSNDMRIRITAEGLYTYPDVVVVCGEPRFADGRADTLLNPALIIEVLSPSTEACDRGFKATQYRQIETLKEHAFVSQDRPHVEVLSRSPNGGWLLSEYPGMNSTCQFACVDCSVALSDIYEAVSFESAEIDPKRPSAAP